MEQGREARRECPKKKIIKRQIQHSIGSMPFIELLRCVTVLSALLPTASPF